MNDSLAETTLLAVAVVSALLAAILDAKPGVRVLRSAAMQARGQR